MQPGLIVGMVDGPVTGSGDSLALGCLEVCANIGLVRCAQVPQTVESSGLCRGTFPIPGIAGGSRKTRLTYIVVDVVDTVDAVQNIDNGIAKAYYS